MSTRREPCLLLISPGIIKWTDMDFGLPHLVALGSYVRQQMGIRVELLDLGYEGGDHRQLARRLDELGPFHMLGVSCYSSFDCRRVVALARFLRERIPGVPLVAGGYHASAVPGDLLPPAAPFDAVVVGEGERPLVALLQQVLGGRPLQSAILGPDPVQDLDQLPPYDWDLLARYWPQAERLGRKLQLHLSRGCPYRCSFCMERVKGEASWRAFSPERALDELERLAARTDLSRWLVNLADPLFGFQRSWRRTVLEGVLERGLKPRQFWTLTRADGLDDEDVALLARARFSIGIGLESGSPRVLEIIGKTRQPQAYLEAILGLARRARRHGLSWAANVIVGHPGETAETLRATAAFARRLYTTAPETCGWLSVDPFRLYPGSGVHADMAGYSQRHGTVFHHPGWWRGWFDASFRAEHIEPSRELGFEERVQRAHDLYRPLVAEVQARFRGQGREVDSIFQRSMAEQQRLLGPEQARSLLHKAARAGQRGAWPEGPAAEPPLPLGLQVRDPWIRRREEATRRLLDGGALRSPAVIEALLQLGPEGFMPPEAARDVLLDRAPTPAVEGLCSVSLGFRATALGLEALQVCAGGRVADLWAGSGWVSALLAGLVGGDGRVVAVAREGSTLARDLQPWSQVEVLRLAPSRLLPHPGPWGGLWLGAALPRIPPPLSEGLKDPGGRLITLLGPRFRPQDLVCLERHDGQASERVLARDRAPVMGGAWGWVPWPAGQQPPGSAAVSFERRLAPALKYRVLSGIDLGADAANLYDPEQPELPWAAPLLRAWQEAPHRLRVQVVGMRFSELDELLHALREHPLSPSRDPADRALAERLAEALQAEASGFVRIWEQDGLRARARLRQVQGEIGAELDRLRSWLYAGQDGDPPPLRVLDCPALGQAGRASSWAGERLVAVSLAEPAEHVLMQVLHEELHPITDPLVRQQRSAARRDTRVGSPGHALHAELESVAIGATRALLEARAPRWLPAFESWCARWTGPTAPP